MRDRLREFSLSLHPEKTRLIEFGRYAAERRAKRGLGKPESFTFLGFTFICGKTRQGKFLLCRKTRRDRMMAKLLEVKEELRRRMHQTIPQQGALAEADHDRLLQLSCRADQQAALSAFRYHTTVLWLRALRRRSQRDRMTWARMAKIAADWLPKPRILHPWPSKRFAVKNPRWEPCA